MESLNDLAEQEWLVLEPNDPFVVEKTNDLSLKKVADGEDLVYALFTAGEDEALDVYKTLRENTEPIIAGKVMNQQTAGIGFYTLSGDMYGVITDSDTAQAFTDSLVEHGTYELQLENIFIPKPGEVTHVAHFEFDSFPIDYCIDINEFARGIMDRAVTPAEIYQHKYQP